MNTPFIRVLGTADWHQTAYNDHSCYTVNDRILIDACPSVITQLLECGVEPLNITAVCFTHMHADHIMGLAPLLHYWRVCRKGDLSGLTIYGPKATVRDAVWRTLMFVFESEERMHKNLTVLPQIVELEGDQALELSGAKARVTDSRHAVPGLCWVFEDMESGRSVGFSGDTAYQDKYPVFFHRVDLLVHECSYGAGPADAVNTSGHSGGYEAARVCREAGAKRLLLTHTYEPKREAALAMARKETTAPVEWAMPGHTFVF